jgi:outer membrane protein OmpA-like peptidoglycan-associated protein
MAAEHEGSGLASSLTDLMTSLAVIFILLLVAMLNNQRQQTAEARNLVVSRLESALERFKRQGVEVKSDPTDPLVLLVIVPEDLLKFEQGKSEIPATGFYFLQTFVPKFVSTACSTELREGISSIVVEGHASSEGSDNDNLSLSQRRSMAVIQQSLTVLDRSSRPDAPAEHKCFLYLISATGRGSAEPVLVNGQEDRPHSRRVVFKIRIKSLEERKEIVTQADLTTSQPAARQYDSR